MILHQTFLIVILSIILSSCSHVDNSKTADTSPYKLQDCLNIYKDILVPVKEIVTDSFYQASNFQKYETLEIDSLSNSTLYLKYRFNVRDTVGDFFMTIGTILSFEKTEEAAQSILDVREALQQIGFNGSPTINKMVQINNLDSLLAFGVTSKFVEYRNQGYLKGYTLTGRTKNIVFIHSIASNHIEHRNHIQILKNKIKILTEFADKHEAKNPSPQHLGNDSAQGGEL